MEKYLFLIVLFGAVPLSAYQAGPANRANFGASVNQQPANQSNGGYRSFTNANNRWRQGVQTQPVQTSVAGSVATEFEPVEKKDSVAKKTAASESTTNKSGVPTAAAQPSNSVATPAASADPTAMLQQVQGMMQGMQGMMNGMEGAATNGQQPAAATGQNAASAMPTGMPDISALMGGMMPTAPAITPAKK